MKTDWNLIVFFFLASAVVIPLFLDPKTEKPPQENNIPCASKVLK